MNDEALDRIADLVLERVLAKLESRPGAAETDVWPDWDELGGVGVPATPLVAAPAPQSAAPYSVSAFRVDPAAAYESQFLNPLRAAGINQNVPPDHVRELIQYDASVPESADA